MNRRDFLKAGAILGAGAAATVAYAALNPGGTSNLVTQTGTTATTNAGLQTRLADPSQ